MWDRVREWHRGTPRENELFPARHPENSVCPGRPKAVPARREDISEELNYSMQWVFELHGKGLLAFAKTNSDFLNNRENQSTTGSKQSKESVE